MPLSISWKNIIKYWQLQSSKNLHVLSTGHLGDVNQGRRKTLPAASGSANESEGAAARRRGLRWAATEQIFSQLKSSKDGAVERARERAAGRVPWREREIS